MDNKPKLLIVEDDLRYADLIAGYMHNYGWDTVMADTMKQCVAVVSDGFSAITLDLRLPDTLGYDALKKLRSVCHSTPIIVVSGFIDEHEYATLISMGADACIQKPSQMDIIVKAIQRAINMRSSRGTLDELYRCHDNLRGD